jgi:hypothetical protein
MCALTDLMYIQDFKLCMMDDNTAKAMCALTPHLDRQSPYQQFNVTSTAHVSLQCLLQENLSSCNRKDSPSPLIYTPSAVEQEWGMPDWPRAVDMPRGVERGRRRDCRRQPHAPRHSSRREKKLSSSCQIALMECGSHATGGWVGCVVGRRVEWVDWAGGRAGGWRWVGGWVGGR